MFGRSKKIEVRPFTVFIGLVGISALLSTIYIFLLLLADSFDASSRWGVAALFNLNSEVSIPTWFSQTILFISSVLLLMIARYGKHMKRYWYGLSGIFLFLSIDEGASIHELITVPVKDITGIENSLFYYSWYIAYGAILIVLGVLYFRFFMNLNSVTKMYFILAAAFFLGGAIGFEALSGSIAAEGLDEASDKYGFTVAAEETFEMLGVSIFIYGLLDHIKKEKIKVKLN